MNIEYRGSLYEAQVPSESVLSWFGDSKVVNDDGSPKVVYHGTTHSFDKFKSSKNPNFIYGGIYFTSSPEDADKHYTGNGGDTKERVRKQMDKFLKMSPKKVGEMIGGLSKQPRKSYNGYHYELVDHLKIEDLAKKMVNGEDPAPNLMPVYLKIVNPFYLDRDNVTYKLTTNPEAPHNTINVVNDGSIGYKLLVGLANECRSRNIDFRDLIIDISNSGEFSGYMFYAKIFRNEELNKLMETKPFFINILKYAGFDGIIMDPGMYFFGNYDKVRHYIVFKSSQAKSVFNKNPSRGASVINEADK